MAKITIGFLIGCLMCGLFAWAYVNRTQESITELESRIQQRDTEIAGLIREAESIAGKYEKELQRLRNSLQESNGIIRAIREQHQSVEQHNSEAQEGAGRLYELTDRLREIAGKIPEGKKDLAECSDPVSDR